MPKFSTPSTIAAVIAAGAVLVPPGAAAAVLAGPEAGTVVLGLWLLKGVLLMLAVLVLITERSDAIGSIERPLVRDLPEPAGWSSRSAALVVALLVLAGVLRVWGLGEGLWYDEIETLVEYARLPLPDIALSYTSQNNHVLYSLAARASTVVFGESAWALRLPAALFGVASIWAVIAFGRRVAPEREALLAGLFLTVSYHHVWFSQNARGYTGLMLWTILGTWAFVLLLSRREVHWGLVVGYGAAMALAAYTHLTAVFTVAAHALVWLVLAWHQRKQASPAAPWPGLAGLVWATMLTVTAYAVVLPQLGETLFSSAGTGGTTEWQSPLWMAIESLRGLQRGLPGGWLGLALGVVVVAAGTAAYWSRSRAVTALMVLPSLVTVAVAAALSHNLWPRFFFFSAGFAVLIVVAGVSRISALLLPRRSTEWATAALVVVSAASALTVPRAWAPKQDFEGAARWVEEAAGPADRVVVVDLTRYPVERYLERPWAAVDNLDTLKAVEDEADRTWLLYTFPIRLSALYPDLWQRVQHTYDTAAVFPGTVGDGAIVVMVTP